MKFTRILSLVLAVLMMAFAFVACADEETENPNDDGTTPEAKAIELSVV